MSSSDDLDSIATFWLINWNLLALPCIFHKLEPIDITEFDKPNINLVLFWCVTIIIDLKSLINRFDRLRIQDICNSDQVLFSFEANGIF
jgi:hypothetical protein